MFSINVMTLTTSSNSLPEARLLPLEVQEAEGEGVQQDRFQSPQVRQLDVEERASRVLLDQLHENICE